MSTSPGEQRLRALQQARHGEPQRNRQQRFRLRGLRDAALMTAAPVPADPAAVIEMLARVVEQAMATVGGNYGVLVLADDPAWQALLPGTRQVHGTIRLHPDRTVTRMRVRPEGVVGHVLRSGEVVWVADTTVESAFAPFPALDVRGVRATAVLPLLAGGRVLGVLQVGFPQPSEMADEDQAALELFASYGAAALERVQLVLAERRRATQAEQLAATLARVGAGADLESAVQALLRGALDLLEGDHGLARIYGDAADAPVRLVVNLYRDGRLDTSTAQPPPPPGSIGDRIRQGEPAVLVDDFQALPDYPLAAQMQREEMRASVNVAIEAGGQRIGSLHVDHHLPGYFEQADLAIAQALAAQAGAAVERARLEAARRQAELELERQTAELERSEAEAGALRELHRLKDEFLGSISHELRTPLTVLHGYAQRIHQRARTLERETIETMMATMVASSAQLSRLVDDLLDFASIERGDLALRLESFDLVEVIRERVKDARTQESGGRVRLDLPETLVVRGDRARTGQVVRNLLDNALKYAAGGTILVSARREGALGRVEVADQGPGIPAAEQTRVWEHFYRGSAVSGLNIVRGSGIGLAVVKTLVEAQGGGVGLDSAIGRGSRFWFELPVPDPDQGA